jgi:hypothetical protein
MRSKEDLQADLEKCIRSWKSRLARAKAEGDTRLAERCTEAVQNFARKLEKTK